MANSMASASWLIASSAPTYCSRPEMLPMLLLLVSCAKPLLKLYSFWFVSQPFYPHSSTIKFTQSLEGFCWATGFYFYMNVHIELKRYPSFRRLSGQSLCLEVFGFPGSSTRQFTLYLSLRMPSSSVEISQFCRVRRSALTEIHTFCSICNLFFVYF